MESRSPAPAGGGSMAERFLTRRRIGWITAGVVALVLALLSLRPTALDVQVAEVGRGPLETTVDGEGMTRVRDRYLIAAPITGRVQRITLRAGDAVAGGAVVARITPLPLDPSAAAQARAHLASAQAGLREAEARVAQAREALDQADRTAARMRAVADEGAISVETAERAELELAAARRNHEAAVSRAQAVAAEVAAARAALLGTSPGATDVAVIRAPASGRVLSVPERSERVVAAGTPLIQVGDAHGLEVVVDVLSTEAVRVQPGAAMRIIEWGGDSALAARVRLVEPAGFTKISTLGVEEQRVNVIGDLLQAPPELGDGYRVQARIVTWSSPAVLKVPNSALFRSGGGWSLFVVDGGRARLRNVEIGHRGTHETEIRDGLESRETVILFPSDRIAVGARVTASRNQRR
jgi:HlyD family secretion protein